MQGLISTMQHFGVQLQQSAATGHPIRPLSTRRLSCRRTAFAAQVVRAGFYGAKDPNPPSRPGSNPKWLDEGASSQPPLGADIGGTGPEVSRSAALTLRNFSVVSFWLQLSLSIVSAIILFFSVTSGAAPGQAPNISTYFTFVGVALSFISTALAHGFRRTARAILMRGDSVATDKVVGSLLRAIGVNLFGLGATVVGLQATTGALVAKTLTSSSQNPYIANPSAMRNAPAALDVFSIQASANTVFAHFVSIALANWLLRVLNRAAAKASPA